MPLDETKSYEIPQNQIFAVVDTFAGRSFSTHEFALGIKSAFPDTWKALEDAYGAGGEGAGVYYSSFSRCAHTLDKLARTGSLDKLDYRPAPVGWGSEVIRFWSSSAQNWGGVDYPDEIDVSAVETLTEGAVQSVLVNRYERNRSARTKCIAKHGLSCVVCGFNFEKVYGHRGAGFIHVHHLKPIGKIGREYKLDPIQDLRPVCPNCHAMLHRRDDDISIDELRQLLSKELGRGS